VVSLGCCYFIRKFSYILSAAPFFSGQRMKILQIQYVFISFLNSISRTLSRNSSHRLRNGNLVTLINKCFIRAQRPMPRSSVSQESLVLHHGAGHAEKRNGTVAVLADVVLLHDSLALKISVAKRSTTLGEAEADETDTPVHE